MRATVPRRDRRPGSALAAVGTALVLAACSAGAGSDDSDTDDSSAGSGGTVVLAVHDSWAMPKRLIRDFERDSGYELEVTPSGDAGELTNKLVLTKDRPIADVVYGIDNTFGSRALEEGVVAAPEEGEEPLHTDDLGLEGDDGAALAPVDWADVCVNVDDRWFADEGLEPPRTADDLTDPRYADLVATPGAATSSPGFAFLLFTIATYGEDGWQDYWRDLVDNGVRVSAGWTEAYEGDFTASGNGDRPVVLSYNTSPPFTIPEGEQRPTTSALLETCYRQVEYAAVLEGAEEPDGARAVVDWLQSREVQEALPENMYVLPADDEAELPPLWERWAPRPEETASLDPARITEMRETWIREWTDLTSG
jgi:thiamine transport system substrate-binding protein